MGYGKRNTELLMMFDSNGRFLDRKKLWKVDNSEYHTCGTLYNVSKVINESELQDSLKYVLISVGVNDCDTKNCQEVFGEIESIFDLIRNKYPGVKIIMSEITPRRDKRDREVQLCNELLSTYANQHDDIFLVMHQNLRDITWSTFYDNKHIRETKIPKFAANIIRALKQAYNIKDKSALYSNERPIFTNNYRSNYRQKQDENQDFNQTKRDLMKKLQEVLLG